MTRSSRWSFASGNRSAASSGDGRTAATVALGLPLAATALGLALVRDLDRHLGWTLTLLGAAFVWQAVAVRRLERLGESSGSGTRRGSIRGVMLVAVLLRLPLLTLPPALSDDALRYLWDGRVAAAGENPYRLAPEAEELAGLREELWRRLPHREVPTVYPPLALGLFSIAARSPAPLAVLKLALTAADLAACALLLGLARRHGVPEARAAWYAWSPLVALETAGMAHVDVLGVAAAVAAVALIVRGRSAGGAALAAAAGVLAKLAPLAALPMWARRSGRPTVFAGVALGTVALALAPVVVASGGVPPGLVVYGVTWEYNGPLYEPLWRAIGAAGLDGAAKGLVARVEGWSGAHRALDRLYPFLYPQLLAKLLLAAGAAAAVVRSIRARDPVAGTRDLFGALLLCSATVYPWYVLWVLPFAALTAAPAWLLLAALAPLAYLPQHAPPQAGIELFPWIWLAIWGPFAIVLTGSALHARRRADRGDDDEEDDEGGA